MIPIADMRSPFVEYRVIGKLYGALLVDIDLLRFDRLGNVVHADAGRSLICVPVLDSTVHYSDVPGLRPCGLLAASGAPTYSASTVENATRGCFRARQERHLRIVGRHSACRFSVIWIAGKV